MSEQDSKHKLTAIFYADVAGYSRLTGQDEIRTHKRVMEVLDFASETIKSDGGVVLRFAGDAILAEFSSVVAAVNSAAFIQTELQKRNQVEAVDNRVEIRIGINLGEVLEDRGEIFGDGVNTAARLESVSSPVVYAFQDWFIIKSGARSILNLRTVAGSPLKTYPNLCMCFDGYRIVQKQTNQSPAAVAPLVKYLLSRYCHLPTCPGTRNRSIWPTVSVKTSLRPCQRYGFLQ